MPTERLRIEMSWTLARLYPGRAQWTSKGNSTSRPTTGKRAIQGGWRGAGYRPRSWRGESIYLIGHQVEIWLYGGIRLRGKLRLKEEMVFIAEDRVRHLELIADQVPFTYRDMESCVRID